MGGHLLETADTVLAVRRIKREVIDLMICDFDVLWGSRVGYGLGWILKQ